ncbi:hypothetical protein D3C81_2085880 [compost metagenome]
MFADVLNYPTHVRLLEKSHLRVKPCGRVNGIPSQWTVAGQYQTVTAFCCGFMQVRHRIVDVHVLTLATGASMRLHDKTAGHLEEHVVTR